MQAINQNNITRDELSLALLSNKNILVDVLRLDKIHPVISGNKWFKLRYYLEKAIADKKTILTFGGAWSNHIAATAAACELHGLPCVAIIRGEEPKKYSATLLQAKDAGMQLYFISRADYADKKIPPDIRTDNCLIIPEGGYGIEGAKGAASILDMVDKEKYTHICCAAGTGTMAAGILNNTLHQQEVLVFSVLKGCHQLANDILQLCERKEANLKVINEFHFGGYAKSSPALFDFMNYFFKETLVPTDFVYTGKMFFGLLDLLEKNYFGEGSKILAIHSGGLQGNQSLDKGTLIF